MPVFVMELNPQGNTRGPPRIALSGLPGRGVAGTSSEASFSPLRGRARGDFGAERGVPVWTGGPVPGPRPGAGERNPKPLRSG